MAPGVVNMKRRTVKSPSSCLMTLLSVWMWNGTAKPLIGSTTVFLLGSTMICVPTKN